MRKIDKGLAEEDEELILRCFEKTVKSQNSGAGVVAQWIKPSLTKIASFIRVLVQVLTALHLIQIPANALGKETEYDSSTWAPSTPGTNQKGVPGLGLVHFWLLWPFRELKIYKACF